MFIGDNVKVGIIGGGAVGLLFGYYLSQNHNVTIFTRTVEQATVLGKEGITVCSENLAKTRKVSAEVSRDMIKNQDFIIVAMKQYHFSTLNLPDILPSDIPILFIQNGMGHLSLMEQMSNEKIFVGTVEHGVRKVNSTTVEHTGIGQTNVAIYRGLEADFTDFPLSRDYHFPFEIKKEYEVMLISKLLANAVINPLTAIFQVKNGELITNPYYFSVSEQLFDEIVSVFPTVNKEQSFLHIKQICLQTRNNTSSMLKDIISGGKTEIDAILGYIMEEGNKVGNDMPLTSAVYNMIKGMEYRGGIEK